jgi:hypothetical protein
LKPLDASILLLSKDEKLVDRIRVEEGEFIQSGTVISFPCHCAHVCEEIFVEVPRVSAPALAPGLNFSCGIAFKDNVKKAFGHPVNCFGSHGRRDFILVISFGHAKLNFQILSFFKICGL